jgi:hypothetical protein
VFNALVQSVSIPEFQYNDLLDQKKGEKEVQKLLTLYKIIPFTSSIMDLKLDSAKQVICINDADKANFTHILVGVFCMRLKSMSLSMITFHEAFIKVLPCTLSVASVCLRRMNPPILMSKAETLSNALKYCK